MQSCLGEWTVVHRYSSLLAMHEYVSETLNTVMEWESILCELVIHSAQANGDLKILVYCMTSPTLRHLGDEKGFRSLNLGPIYYRVTAI